MSDESKILGVTSQDLLATIIANSPLVGVNLVEVRSYRDAGHVPIIIEGYLSGPIYDKLCKAMRLTPEGFSAMLDGIQADSTSNFGPFQIDDLLEYIWDEMVVTKMEPAHEVDTTSDKEYFDDATLRQCSFKLLLRDKIN